MRQLTGKVRLFAVALLAAAVAVPVALAGGTPSLSFAASPSSSFGTVETNSTTSRTYLVTNSGGSATGALRVTLSGASDFSISSDSCSATSLGPKKSCSVGVSYHPTTDGANDAATLSVSSKKPPASAMLSLSGQTAAAASYPQSRTDCEAAGGTFTPGTDLLTTGATVWTCGSSLTSNDPLFTTLYNDCGADLTAAGIGTEFEGFQWYLGTYTCSVSA